MRTLLLLANPHALRGKAHYFNRLLEGNTETQGARRGGSFAAGGENGPPGKVRGPKSDSKPTRLAPLAGFHPELLVA